MADIISVDNLAEAFISPSLERFQRALDSYCAVYEKLEGWRDPELARSLLDKGRRVRKGKVSWTKSDVKRIVYWKRLQLLMGRIEESGIESRLADAFRIQDEVGRIEALCGIPGVGPAIASTLLALTYPEEYAALDNHAWSALCRLGFDLPSKPFSGGAYTIAELMRYEKILVTLSRMANATPWDVAKALHALDQISLKTKWTREFESRKTTMILSPFTTSPPIPEA